MASVLDSLGRWVKPLLVRVTEKDIANSIRNSSVGCMTNVAFKRALKKAGIHARRVKTDEQTMDVTADGVRRQMLTPDAVRRAIIDYDAGLAVLPFRVHLDPTCAVITPVAATVRAPREVRQQREAAVQAVASATGGIPDARPHRSSVLRRTRKDRRYGARALYINQVRPVQEILEQQIAMGKAAAELHNQQMPAQ